MKKDSDKLTDQQKGGFPITTISLWAAAVIILYLLGSGPFVMLLEKRALSDRTHKFLETMYFPMGWAYDETPLHKPIGLYLHLWSTNFDSSGDYKIR